MRKETYYCDICKKENGFEDLESKIKFPKSLYPTTDDDGMTWIKCRYKKLDICYECLNIIIGNLENTFSKLRL